MKRILIFSLIFIVLVELTLQLAAFIVPLLYTQSVSPAFDQQEVRILTIGESTTADIVNGGRERAWPGRLLKKLKARFPAKSILVSNIAEPGANTNLLIKKARESIEKFRPHIIITMMGINDWSYNDTERSPWWLKVRSVKLFRELRRHYYWENEHQFYSCSDPLWEGRLSPAQKKALLQIAKDANGSVASFVQRLRGHPDIDPIDAHIVAGVLLWEGDLTIDAPPELNKVFAAQLFQNAYKFKPNCGTTFQYLMFSYLIEGKKDLCRNELVNLHERKIPLTAILVRLLADCKVASQDKEAQELLEYYGYFSSAKNPIQMTIRNYNLLYQMAQESNAELYVMSYPRTRAASLATVLSSPEQIHAHNFRSFILETQSPQTSNIDLKGVRFIDQGDSFEDLIQRTSLNRVFKDMFAVKFGHTTDVGNDLIAENVFQVLSQSAIWEKQ